jgi:hypothetical protein
VTLDSLFLLLVTTYLVLIAYGVVGARRRLTARARAISVGLMVILPPALIAILLLAMEEGALVRQWGRLFIAMTLAGIVVAFVAEQVARRVGA